MRKTFAILLSIFVLLSLLSSCGEKKNEKYTIVTTNFSIYDWTKNVVGEKCDVKLLIDGGADVHSFQPSVKDISLVASCDALICVGGESEEWIDDALENNENAVVLKLLHSDAFTAYKEELTEGMEGEEEDELDEHIWLSVNVAEKCVNKIADVLSEKLPDIEETFKKNASDYALKLKELDESFRSRLEKKTLVFADRFPFRYFVEDYGISYYAPFSGCSAESEASAKTVLFLTEKVKELGAKSVFVLSGNNKKLAKTIAPDAEILILNSIENTSTSENTSYVKLMSQNMETLLRAI